MWYGRDPLGFVPSSFLAPDAQEEEGGVVQYYVTQLEQRTDKAEVGGETTCYHLLGRGSQAFADPTAHSFFILGLELEIVNLQEEGITLHTSISAIEFGEHVAAFQQADL